MPRYLWISPSPRSNSDFINLFSPENRSSQDGYPPITGTIGEGGEEEEEEEEEG